VKVKRVVHPFLFALLPALMVFSYNSAGIGIRQTIFPVVIVCAITFILWTALGLLVKDISLSALLLSPAIFGIFSYGMFYDYIKGGIEWNVTHGLILTGSSIIFLLLYGIYARWLLKSKNNMKKDALHTLCAMVGMSLVIYNLCQIGYAKWEERKKWADDKSIISFPEGTLRPDIYFIVLDQYASFEEIKKVHNYDNSDFAEYLSRLGFYLPSNSRSIYDITHLSLATSLNMEPAGLEENRSQLGSFSAFLMSSLGEDTCRDWNAFKMIRNNRVVRILKANGYKYVHLGGGWFYYTRYNRWADVDINYFGFHPKNEFVCLLLDASIARIPMIVINRGTTRGCIEKELDALSQVPEITGPKFVFAHVICPHPPFVFGQNGEKVSGGSYKDQYAFVTKKARIFIDNILSKSKTPPIIVLQSDHGSKAAPQYSHHIFNAVYLPDHRTGIISDTLSSQNMFRVIFNEYFGGKYPLLQDDTDKISKL
jgi:hypothetical protein